MKFPVDLEREGLAAVWRHKRFLFGYSATIALALLLAAGWFWIPDSSTAAVILSLVSAPVLLAAILIALAGPFAYYREPASVPRLFRESVRRVPMVAIFAALLGAALWLPLRWALIPWLLAPLLFGRPRFYLFYLAATATGALLPYALVNWHPPVGGTAAQTISLCVRFLVAFACAITSWLAAASVIEKLRAANPQSPAAAHPSPIAPPSRAHDGQ